MSYNSITQKYEGFIYVISNDNNDKLYIGQTINSIKERWHGHLSARLNPKYNSILYRAMRKYGTDSFHIRELLKIETDTIDKLTSQLNIKEQEYILLYHSSIYENGYNIEWGGNNKRVKGRTVCKYDINLHLIDTYISTEEAGRQNNIDGATIYNCCKHDYYMAGGYIWAFEDQLPMLPLYKTGEHKPYKLLEGIDLHINDYIIQEAPNDIYKQNRLLRSGWNGKKINLYNSYGEIVKTYNSIVDVIDDTSLNYKKLNDILTGKSCIYNKYYTFRYEGESFNNYPISNAMQAITIYNLQGEIVKHFPTKHEAELFLKVPSGEITKTLNRQGSCKGYLVSKYGEPLIRTLKNNKYVYCMCDDNGNTIKEYYNQKELAKDLDISLWTISHELTKAIQEHTKFSNYFWKYKEEYYTA